MTSHIDPYGTSMLIAENERLLAACREARIALAASYGVTEPVTVAPLEQPSPAWEQARDEAEREHGRRLWKYFTKGV